MQRLRFRALRRGCLFSGSRRRAGCCTTIARQAAFRGVGRNGSSLGDIESQRVKTGVF